MSAGTTSGSSPAVRNSSRRRGEADPSTSRGISVPIFFRSNTQLLPRNVDKLFMLAMAVTETLEGSVLRVVFTAPDASFAVLRVQVDGRDEPVSVVGPLAESTAGELLKLEGSWERHP